MTSTDNISSNENTNDNDSVDKKAVSVENELKEDIPQLSDDDIELEVSSMDSESSSSESEFDSDDDKEVNNEYLSDEDDSSNVPIISKNEVTNEIASKLPDDYELGNKPIEMLGVVCGFVDNSIIIKGQISGEFRILKENSILCIKDKPLGLLFEVFGNLKTPLYRIKFNNEDEEHYNQLKQTIPLGEQVYYVVPESQFIYTDQIKVKGSDASNFNDEEIPEDEQEFSDDEQEMMAKKKRKKKNSLRNDKKPKFDYQSRSERNESLEIFQSYGMQQETPLQPQIQPQIQRQSQPQIQPQFYPPPYLPQQVYPSQYHPQQAYIPSQNHYPPQNQMPQPYNHPYNYQQPQYPQPQHYNSYPPAPQHPPEQAFQTPSSVDLSSALQNASPEQIQMIQQLLNNKNVQ